MLKIPYKYCMAVVPNLGSMDPLVVHRRYQGIHRIRNFVLRLIGGGPQPKKFESRCCMVLVSLKEFYLEKVFFPLYGTISEKLRILEEDTQKPLANTYFLDVTMAYAR